MWFIVLAACGTDSNAAPGSSEPAVDIPTKQEIVEEAHAGAKHVLEGGGWKWKASFSGAHEGEIKGKILTSMTLPNSIQVQGAAMSADMKSQADQEMRLTILAMEGTEPKVMKAHVVLEDGTVCALDPEGSQVVAVGDTERRTFRASVTAPLLCGDAKKPVQMAAVMNAKP